MKPILVVEDSDEDYASILDGLQRAQITNPVERLTDGESCLAQLTERGRRGLKPSLLLLDLNLPGMDGRTLLAEIKSDPLLRPLPVLIFTTSANPVDVAACYQNGANGYHLKPLDVPAFRQVIQDIAHYWLDKVILP